MSDSTVRHCLFLPCSAAEIWAVPKNSLAEIVTLYEVGELPPEWLEWRGQRVPVLDMDDSRETRWRDPRAGTGLVAILLGVEGAGCPYIGIALRGQGLGLHEVPESEVEDCPAEALPRSMGAFRWRHVTYQVPDLMAVLEELAERLRMEEDIGVAQSRTG